MKTLFQAGQIVRFKNYNPKEGESEAYFIVLIPKDKHNDCWIQCINSNRYSKAEHSWCPEDTNDLELVSIQAKTLLNQEVVIKEGLYHDIVIDKVDSVDSPDTELTYKKTPSGFVSNVTYTMGTEILKGKLYHEIPNIILVKR